MAGLELEQKSNEPEIPAMNKQNIVLVRGLRVAVNQL